jgi:hypothetical protein
MQISSIYMQFPLRFCVIVTLVATLLAAPLRAAENTAPEKPADNSVAMTVASTLTTVTGMAISPLLGTGAYGAYLHFKASDD